MKAICFESHAQDARYKEVRVCPAVTTYYGTGGGNVPLILQENGNTRTVAEDVAPSLRTTVRPVFCVAGNTIGRGPKSGGNGLGVSEDKSFTITTSDVDAAMTNDSLRRLLPVECERLQGFPDDYTKVPYRGGSAEDCPDAPRYRAIGNSWAVPVVRWIGKRITQECKD